MPPYHRGNETNPKIRDLQQDTANVNYLAAAHFRGREAAAHAKVAYVLFDMKLEIVLDAAIWRKCRKRVMKVRV
jgi:hypothetical protein